MSEVRQVRERLKNLILNTCNTIGCKDCPFKWEEDSDGNACQSDYLMHQEFLLTTDTDS